jgi:hypothetical protein
MGIIIRQFRPLSPDIDPNKSIYLDIIFSCIRKGGEEVQIFPFDDLDIFHVACLGFKQGPITISLDRWIFIASHPLSNASGRPRWMHALSFIQEER